MVGGNQVHQKSGGSAVEAAQSESPEQASKNDADDVVPIKERKGIAGSKLPGVGP